MAIVLCVFSFSFFLCRLTFLESGFFSVCFFVFKREAFGCCLLCWGSFTSLTNGFKSEGVPEHPIKNTMGTRQNKRLIRISFYQVSLGGGGLRGRASLTRKIFPANSLPSSLLIASSA